MLMLKVRAAEWFGELVRIGRTGCRGRLVKLVDPGQKVTVDDVRGQRLGVCWSSRHDVGWSSVED